VIRPGGGVSEVSEGGEGGEGEGRRHVGWCQRALRVRQGPPNCPTSSSQSGRARQHRSSGGRSARCARRPCGPGR
jgi:hypothetical protein